MVKKVIIQVFSKTLRDTKQVMKEGIASGSVDDSLRNNRCCAMVTYFNAELLREEEGEMVQRGNEDHEGR